MANAQAAGSMITGAACGLVALAAAGWAPPASAADPALRADLEKVAGRAIFFGHQSVGGNVLDGVKALAAQEGVALRLAEVADAGAVGPGTFGHAFIPENGKPELKLEGLERALGPGPAGVEVAFLKLCFVDVEGKTDARALFERYRTTLATLQARHPRTTFVHLTVPLTTVQGGWKAVVKGLLGRAPYGFEENVRREEYNALLRAAYQGKEPLFDVARLESTAPDGRPVTSTVKGRTVPSMHPAYTDDGGHLAGEGRRVVARALLRFLAELPAPPAGAAGSR
jgi:hypothetical protein